jgi:glyoxylase-like metal-dependent hydrolase (beta-lactamase superfamily II)
MSLCGTNSYIFSLGHDWILVDTCSPPPNHELFLKNLNIFLEDFGGSISHILITHSHYDHIGALP